MDIADWKVTQKLGAATHTKWILYISASEKISASEYTRTIQITKRMK